MNGDLGRIITEHERVKAAREGAHEVMYDMHKRKRSNKTLYFMIATFSFVIIVTAMVAAVLGVQGTSYDNLQKVKKQVDAVELTDRYMYTMLIQICKHLNYCEPISGFHPRVRRSLDGPVNEIPAVVHYDELTRSNQTVLHGVDGINATALLSLGSSTRHRRDVVWVNGVPVVTETRTVKPPAGGVEINWNYTLTSSEASVVAEELKRLNLNKLELFKYLAEYESGASVADARVSVPLTVFVSFLLKLLDHGYITTSGVSMIMTALEELPVSPPLTGGKTTV
jgi:hypothetical protein